MNYATPITNAVEVRDFSTFDGISWFRTPFDSARGYESFKELPNIVQFNNKIYTKSSFNTDSGYVTYREHTAFLARGA